MEPREFFVTLTQARRPEQHSNEVKWTMTVAAVTSVYVGQLFQSPLASYCAHNLFIEQNVNLSDIHLCPDLFNLSVDAGFVTCFKMFTLEIAPAANIMFQLTISCVSLVHYSMGPIHLCLPAHMLLHK